LRAGIANRIYVMRLSSLRATFVTGVIAAGKREHEIAAGHAIAERRG